MAKLNLKAIKRIVWLCIGYCIIYICYGLYDILYREYINRSLEIKISICLVLITTILALIFVVRLLQGIKKHNQVFAPNNHRWLIYTSISLFIQPFLNTYISAFFYYYNGEWVDSDWLSVFLNPILLPRMIPYILTGLMLLIVAYLYKLGEQAVEDQRLTI